MEITKPIKHKTKEQDNKNTPNIICRGADTLTHLVTNI